MQPLPQIPVTPRVIRRQFREPVVPPMIFPGLVALALALWIHLYGSPPPNEPDRAQGATVRRTTAETVSERGVASEAKCSPSGRGGPRR